MNILAILSPLITVALLGYICTKTKWLSRDQLNAISKITFSICIPAFLFYQMVKADFSDQVSPQLFAAFYLPILTCYFVAWLVSYFFYKAKQLNKSGTSAPQNSAASAVFALGASYSNTIIVGLPVLLAALGEQVIGIIFLIVTFHSAMLFALTSAIAAKVNSKSRTKKHNWFMFIKQTVNNPLIISILSGLLFNVLGIALPDFLQDSLVLISKPAIALALFILGASLAFYQVRQELTFISIACFIKLLLLPTVVLITSQYIFNLEAFVITVLVILSACPTGINAYLIAANHQHHQQTVAGTVVLSTLISIVTIPLWLSFIL
jgi:predicted permease